VVAGINSAVEARYREYNFVPNASDLADANAPVTRRINGG